MFGVQAFPVFLRIRYMHLLLISVAEMIFQILVTDDMLEYVSLVAADEYNSISILIIYLSYTNEKKDGGKMLSGSLDISSTLLGPSNDFCFGLGRVTNSMQFHNSFIYTR